METDCVFCKIINGDIPSYKVYEDDFTLAFLDIHPKNYGHTLIIPKEHTENIYSIPDEDLCRLILGAKKIAIAVKNGMDADGINVSMNNEGAAGQDVFHAHIHIVPRFNEDDFKHGSPKKYKEGEAESTVDKIKQALAN